MTLKEIADAEEAAHQPGPRCPKAHELAKVIYERAFDCRWDKLAETSAEYWLWIEVAKAVRAQFFSVSREG